MSNFSVYKYKLDYPGETTVEMPLYSQVLTAQLQGSDLCVWVRCSTVAPTVPRKFSVIGTGWDADFDGRDFKYVATIQEGNRYVWHVFEEGR